MPSEEEKRFLSRFDDLKREAGTGLYNVSILKADEIEKFLLKGFRAYIRSLVYTNKPLHPHVRDLLIEMNRIFTESQSVK